MDLTSSWVLLLVVLLGGVIALYADRLGRNLGKKRLKLGSLRPRRTAEVIVFAAGMLTPLIAILAIMAVSAEARIWILRGYKAAQEARQAVQERDRALKEYERVLKQARDLDIQIQDLQGTLEAARRRSGEYEAKASKAESRAKVADQRVRSLAGEVTIREHKLGAVQKSLTAAGLRLQTMSSNVRQLNRDREDLYKQVDNLNGEITDLETKIKSGQGDLTKMSAELTQKQSELQAAERARQKAVDDLAAALEDMDRQLEQARQTLEQFQVDVRDAAARWLTEPLIFRKDDEVARLSVGAQLSQSEAERSLDAVLSEAQRIAIDRGAGRNDSGSEAGFLPYTQDDGTRLSPEQQRQLIVRQLTGRSSESVIVAKVLVNRFSGQFLPLQVTVHPNPIVFRAGQLLGETRIEATTPVGKMFDEIGALLREQVRQKALEGGMLPVSGREDGFGSVTPEEIFALMTSIQNFGRTARLQVLSKNDTRAGGPLALEFRLR